MGSFLEKVSIKGKSLRNKLMVIASLLFLLPSFVVSYILHSEGISLRSEHPYFVIIVLTLVLSLAGLIILRKVFDEFLMVVAFMKRAEAGEIVSMEIDKDTAKFSEMSLSFNKIIKRLEETSNRLEEQTLELKQAVAGRHRAEETLNSFEKAFGTMQLGVTIIDIEGKIIYTNPAEADMHGYTVEELIGKEVRIFAPPDLCNYVPLYQIKDIKTFKRESVNVRKDGSTFPVQLISDVITNIAGYRVGFITTCEDITERKKAGEMLQKACNELEMRVEERTAEFKKVNEQLQQDIAERKRAEEKILNYQARFRSLIVTLALLEERERKRISEELHDNISQNLSLSKIKIAAILESISSSDTAEGLDEIGRLLEEAIQFTRSLMSDLSPTVLYNLGFEAAVEQLTDKIQEKYGIIVDFVSDKRLKKINGEISIFLYKTVRELLINIVKHAQACKAKVAIGSDGNNIQISVEDDGIGFDVEKLYGYSGEKETFGLFGINERINHIGGTIKIKSLPQQGTLVDLIVPIEPDTNK